MLAPPVILTLPTAPKLLVPLTVNPVNVPRLVILGCALVVTVPAVVAFVAVPDNAPVKVVADTLPNMPLPVAFNVPAMFAPVDVTTITLGTLLTLIVTLPLGLVISTLLLPFTILST